LATLEKMSPIWDVMTRFGIGSAEWHPYWETPVSAAAQPDSVKVSLYARRDSFWGKGRALLVVSNLSPGKPVTADVAVDFLRLGVTAKSATDALTREALTFANGRIAVPLEPMRMRLVWVD